MPQNPKFKINFSLKTSLVLSINILKLALLNLAFLGKQTSANQDPHVFYLENPSTNKCLTVASNKLKTDIDCNSWEEQQWLYMGSTNKIASVSNPDYCLQFLSTTDYKITLCSKNDDGVIFSAPTVLTISGSATTFTAYYDASFIIKSDKIGLAQIAKTTCMYQEISKEAQNSMILLGSGDEANQRGFDLGDVTSWKCDQGYQSVDKRTESVAECTADGSWSMDGGSSMLSCIRVRCERPITEQPDYVHEVCRAGSSSVSSFCISEDKPANAYRLVDNQLVEYIPEQDVNVHFFFDDEIIFKCSESSHRNLDGTTEPISSVCSATGKWTVVQPMCKGKCEKQITVKQNEHACGVWTTENFPEPYENGMSCPVRFKAEDPETRFKIQIRFVLLEYKSRFATSCNSLDRLEFKSYTDNFSTPAAAAFADGDKILESKICAHSSSYASKSFDFGHWVDQETCAGNASCMNCGEEFTSKKSYLSTEWDHWQPKTLTSSTNEFVARFVSDKDTRKTGVAFTWWTENDADTLNSNSSCLNHKNYQFSNETISKLCNVTHLRDNKAYQDEQYGFYSDIYHVFYIIILAYAIVKLMWFLAKVFYKLLTCQYRKVDKQMKEGDSEDEDDDSDFSDSESEYDMDEDEDDVDDFSLLTLLEMKANRVELGNAVDKLTNEITHLEQEEDNLNKPNDSYGTMNMDKNNNNSANNNNNKGNRNSNNSNRSSNSNINNNSNNNSKSSISGRPNQQ